MICEACGGARLERECTPVTPGIVRSTFVFPHQPAECVAHLRQQLAALTLRVEALEQSELAGVLPDLPVGLSSGRLRVPYVQGLPRRLQGLCDCLNRWQMGNFPNPEPGERIPHDAWCELQRLDESRPD